MFNLKLMNMTKNQHTQSAGRYANILYDDAFKVVVCAPGNEELVKHIIELLIPTKRIKTLTMQRTEQHGLSIYDKNSTFDVLCESEKGEQFIVEMQYTEQRNFADRMLCYASFPIRLQMAQKVADAQQNPGKKMDYTLLPIYVVSIVNFTLKHESDDALEGGFISRYDLRNPHNAELMTDALHFVNFELGRLKVKADEPKQCKTLLEKFAWSVMHMDMQNDRPDGFDDPLLEQLYNAAEFANMTVEHQQQYEQVMRTIIDERAILDFETDKARQQERIAIAKQMLAKGFAPSDIAEITGLSVEDLAKL